MLFISLFLNVICIVSYGETKNEITSLEGKWKYIGRVDKKTGNVVNYDDDTFNVIYEFKNNVFQYSIKLPGDIICENNLSYSKTARMIKTERASNSNLKCNSSLADYLKDERQKYFYYIASRFISDINNSDLYFKKTKYKPECNNGKTCHIVDININAPFLTAFVFENVENPEQLLLISSDRYGSFDSPRHTFIGSNEGSSNKFSISKDGKSMFTGQDSPKSDLNKINLETKEILKFSLKQSIKGTRHSPNNKYVALISEANFDDTLTIMNAQNGNILMKFQSKGNLDNLAWSPNGNFLSYVYWNRDRKTSSLIISEIGLNNEAEISSANLADINYYDGQKFSVSWSHDNKLIAFNNGNTVDIFNSISRKKIYTYSYDSTLTNVEWSPSSNDLMIITEDKIYLEKFNNRTKLFLGDTHQEKIIRSVWSPKGDKIATFTASSLLIWSIEDKNYQTIKLSNSFDLEPIESCPSYKDYCAKYLSWSPDQKMISFRAKNNIVIYDVSTLAEKLVIAAEGVFNLVEYQWMPDSQSIIISKVEAEWQNEIKRYITKFYKVEF